MCPPVPSDERSPSGEKERVRRRGQPWPERPAGKTGRPSSVLRRCSRRAEKSDHLCALPLDSFLPPPTTATLPERVHGVPWSWPRPADGLDVSDLPERLSPELPVGMAQHKGRQRNGRPVGRYLMCVHVGPTATQIAVLEGRLLIEHCVVHDDEAQIYGNVYVGRVQNREHGSPRRSRCPGASWSSFPTRRPTASPGGSSTTSASVSGLSSTRSRPRTTD